MSILTQWTVINIFHGLTLLTSESQTLDLERSMSRKTQIVVAVILLLNLDIAF